MKRTILFILLFGLCRMDADQADDWYAKGSSQFHQIKQGKISNTKSNWNKAIQYFEKAAAGMKPTENRYGETYFSLGLCHTEIESYLRAITAFRQVVKAQSGHRLADDAQYLTAYCFLQRGETNQAMLEFERVVFNHPNGDMLHKALNSLEELYRKKPDPKRETALYQHIVKSVKNNSLVYTYQQKLKDIQIRSASKPTKPIPKPKPTVPSQTPPTGKTDNSRFAKIRISSAEISSRIVIEFDKLPEYKFNLLNDKKILYIDFINTVIPEPRDVQEINNGIIRTIHVNPFTPSILRLSIAINTDCQYHIFSLDNPARIVADLSIKKGDPSSADHDKPPVSTGKNEVNLINQLGLKVSTIIIDAGHGGKDPGTLHSKTFEKDIVFKIAAKLAKKLSDDPEFQVILTRNRDEFLALEERTELANSSNGDLFISLHVNSAPSTTASGIETYYLSLTQDIWAQRLAARENATTLLKIADLNNLLSSILINSKMDESVRFAGIT
ncbi:MAG: N-acetylmuramoyl-L-alanine amidase, partial [Candidatus Delongbacteria bacterium]|nr:N-acetylmuramoyl-L-alanine amidase [Candidatus Delongbacteria bacterium]